MKVFHAGGLDISINPMTFGIERVVMINDASSFCFVKGKSFALPCGNNFLIEKDLSRDDSVHAKFLYFSDITATFFADESEGRLRFRYVFRNEGKKAVSTEEGELGVYFPFNDTYDVPRVALKRRVHSFVRTDGSLTYIRTIRTSGAPHALALIMTKGECSSYKTELNAFRTDSGMIALSVPALHLEAGETYEWEFVLAPYADEADFKSLVNKLGILWATADGLVLRAGESLSLRSETAEKLIAEGVEYPFLDGVCSISANGSGAHVATIACGEKRADVRYYVRSDDTEPKRREFLLSKGRSENGEFGPYDRGTGERVCLKRPVLSQAELAPLLYLLRAARKGDFDLSAVSVLADRYAEVLLDMRVPKRASETEVLYRILFAYEMSLVYPDREELLMWSAVMLRDLFASGVPALPTVVTRVVETLREKGKDTVARELVDSVIAAADKLLASENKCMDRGYSPLAECGALSLLSAAYLFTENEYYSANAMEHLAAMDATAAPSLDYRTNDFPSLLGRDDTFDISYEMSPYIDAVYFAVAYDDFARASGDRSYAEKARRILDVLQTLFDISGGARRGVPLPAEANDRATAGALQISYGEDIILYFNELLF